MYQKSEANRLAVMAKCMAAEPVPAWPPPERPASRSAGDDNAQQDQPGSSLQSRGRSRVRGSDAARAHSLPSTSVVSVPGDVDMEPEKRAQSVRGPNQYKCAALMCIFVWQSISTKLHDELAML